jgi:hypothetical protein
LTGIYPTAPVTFSTGGGVLLQLEASAYTTIASSFMETGVSVDGVVVASLRVFTNEANSQKALAARAVVLSGLAAGSHARSSGQLYPLREVVARTPRHRLARRAEQQNERQERPIVCSACHEDNLAHQGEPSSPGAA